jgi:hypothetical protein
VVNQVGIAPVPSQVIEVGRPVRHCIACQCARIARFSASGVSPVSTSPALLTADQVPPSALKPWYPPSAQANSISASAASLVHRERVASLYVRGLLCRHHRHRLLACLRYN